MSNAIENFSPATSVHLELGPEGEAAASELRSFVERVERLEQERKTIADDIGDVYGEAKSRGYDTKVLRKVVSLRKQDANERAEMDAILDLYLQALGMTAEAH